MPSIEELHLLKKITPGKEEKKSEKLTKKEEDRIHVQILEKTVTLMGAGMGLVAALAWNEAIKKLFVRIFGEQSSGDVVAMFIYAAVVTMVVVLVTLRLTKILEKMKRKSGEE